MRRDDIKGTTRVPKAVQDYLTLRGGKNPYGEPIWRICLAQNRYTKQGGVFHDWDDNLSLAECGGIVLDDDGHMTPSEKRPDRVTEEMREMEKYPGTEGWILERWFPARHYGSQEQWYAEKTPTGIPVLGPYPELGDYEMIYGPARDVPNISDIETCLQAYQHGIESRKGTVAARHLEYVRRAEARKAQKTKRASEEAEYMLREHTGNILKSTSLAAGRYREELAKRAGIKEHVGN